jgi:putative phage-type endonuclease
MNAVERLAWRKERKSGLGASDAPKLVGLGWGKKNAGHVYRDKTTDHIEPDSKTGPLARGTVLEPIVAQMYEELMGAELVLPPNAIARHPERSWQFASPDRFRADDGRPVQLKTALHFGDEWGSSGTDDLPDGYRVQVQQEMGVLGAPFCDLAALDITEWELRVYRVAFDADFFAWLTEIEERFWREHVLARVPPTIEWEAQFSTAARARIAKTGTRVELDPSVEALLTKREELRAIEKEAKADFDALGEQIMLLMGSAEIAHVGDLTVKKITVKPHTVPAQERAGHVYLGKPTKRKDK